MHRFLRKKKFGQYFLKEDKLAKKIVDSLSLNGYNTILEIGPGLGILTKYLINKNLELLLIEIDKKIVKFLKRRFPIYKNKIIQKDFLKWNPEKYKLHNFAVIGNFPYNISKQILFHILKYEKYIPECIGMFQKEVAERITAKSGNKKYGVLSVLVQSIYNVKYLFTVHNSSFTPIPKVQSGVISLKRKDRNIVFYNRILFNKFVKTAFNQRRKKLKNSLKSFQYIIPYFYYDNFFMDNRAEDITVEEFVKMVSIIEKNK